MKLYKALKTNPSKRDLLQFGVILLVGLGLVGSALWFRFDRPSAALGCWIAGAAVFLLSFVPPVGRWLYILWMGLGITIGLFTSPIILMILYLLLIVPVGLVFRIVRRDSMRRRIDPKAASYWEEYRQADDPASYLRQS
jgi:hypothetical protein